MQDRDAVADPVLPDPELPFAGESLLSLLARYAGLIGIAQPARVLTPIGLEHMTPLIFATHNHDDKTTSAIQKLLALDDVTFSAVRSWTAERSCQRISGHEFPSKVVSTDRRRFCPGCLGEAAFHRAVWDCTLVPGCGRHRTTLLSACPVCGTEPRWGRSWAHRCSNLSCGADLSQGAWKPDLDAEAAVTCTTIESLFHAGLPSGWAPLGVADTLQAAARLGSYALGMPWGYVVKADRRNPADLIKVMQRGFAALSDWPHGLHTLLGRQRQGSADRRGRYGAAKELGPMASWLWAQRDSVMGGVLCPVVDTWLAGQSDMTTRLKEIGTIRHTGQPSVLTIPQAAQRLGVGAKVIRSMAEQHYLFTLAPQGKGAMALVDIVALERLLAGQPGVLDRKGAATLLGVGKEALVDMLDLGVVRELPPKERILKDLGFARDVLIALMETLEATALTRGPVEGAQSLRTTAIGMPGGRAQLLRAVLDGAVRPVGVDTAARGVDRLLFAAEQKRMAPRRIPEGCVSIKDLGVELGIDGSSMTEMVTAGFFDPDENGVAHSRRRAISHQAIERFRRDYILTPEIAASTEFPWQGMVLRLERLGVRPISGRGVDGLRRHVFRRADVDAVVEALQDGQRAMSTRKGRTGPSGSEI